MEEIIRKLIAVDKAAREKVEKVEEKRDALAAGMSELKEEAIVKAQKDFSHQLDLKKSEIRAQLEREFSKEILALEDERVMAEMDRLFEEKKDEWVKEIFEKTVE